MSAGGDVEASFRYTQLQFIGDNTVLNIGQAMLFRPCLCIAHHGSCDVKTDHIPIRADTLRDGKRWITVAARKIKHALSSCDAGHGEQSPGDRGGLLGFVFAGRASRTGGSGPPLARPLSS